MRTVHKYEIDPQDNFGIEIPERGIIIAVAMQNGRMYAWVDGDNEDCYVRIPIYVFGTGHEIDSELQIEFISTVFDGPYIWHVYHGAKP